MMVRDRTPQIQVPMPMPLSGHIPFANVWILPSVPRPHYPNLHRSTTTVFNCFLLPKTHYPYITTTTPPPHREPSPTHYSYHPPWATPRRQQASAASRARGATTTSSTTKTTFTTATRLPPWSGAYCPPRTTPSKKRLAPSTASTRCIASRTPATRHGSRRSAPPLLSRVRRSRSRAKALQERPAGLGLPPPPPPRGTSADGCSGCAWRRRNGGGRGSIAGTLATQGRAARCGVATTTVEVNVRSRFLQTWTSPPRQWLARKPRARHPAALLPLLPPAPHRRPPRRPPRSGPRPQRAAQRAATWGVGVRSLGRHGACRTQP